jgi:hypothetical protein
LGNQRIGKKRIDQGNKNQEKYNPAEPVPAGL